LKAATYKARRPRAPYLAVSRRDYAAMSSRWALAMTDGISLLKSD
jgi:hypothetical protein